ncbi:hypothetical protein [Caulobacter hibisci]|nr:hypothetical protein [Caulobacter hibisci]
MQQSGSSPKELQAFRGGPWVPALRFAAAGMTMELLDEEGAKLSGG